MATPVEERKQPADRAVGASARARVRRDRARLVRRPRRAGRRDAVPRERHARTQRPARAAARRRPPLRAVRRRQPDQRPEPRADRGTRARAAPTRHRAADLLRQPQLASVPRGHDAADDATTASAARSRSSRLRSAPTRAAASTARISSTRSRRSGRTRPRCRARACSSTIRASSRRTSTACAPPCRSSARTTCTSRSPHTRFPSAMAANCAYEAQLREAARLVAEAVGVDGLGGRLPEPQRLAAGAVARARHRRPPASGARAGRTERS